MTAFVTILAVVILAILLAIGPLWLAFVIFVGIIALGRWLTLPPRCPECNERMVENWTKQQTECRGCGIGSYWK